MQLGQLGQPGITNRAPQSWRNQRCSCCQGVLTGTRGKALGGTSGGYTSGRKEIIDLLRQRSRPYLFSNTIPPVVAGATLKCLEMLTASTALRDKLHANTAYYREGLVQAGLTIKPGTHPIVFEYYENSGNNTWQLWRN